MKKVKQGDVQYGGDKSGSEAETGQRRRRDRYGLHTGSSGSAQECNWVVGSQILTNLIEHYGNPWNYVEQDRRFRKDNYL